MSGMTHHEVVTLLIALGLLLGVARILGEVARRLRQPAVIGELCAGILLGPTILGSLAPELSTSLFPREGNLPVVMHGLTTLAITLFLLVAGLEVDLATIWRRRTAALSVGIGGMLIPVALAFPLAYFAPGIMGADDTVRPLIFALFMSVGMAISALPVVAKMLIDLQLFKTDVGMTVIAAAVFNDLIGWLGFALVLAMMAQGTNAANELPVWQTIALTLGFTAFMLTIGRLLIDRSLPWVHAHLSYPGGVLGFTLTLTIFCAAFTEWLGVHAIFGAFIFGVALGDSRHMRHRTRETIDQFVSFIFAPLFFASIGLRVDFVENFDLGLTLLVLAIATIGKLAGCVPAARLAGFSTRESWAIGFGLNARGAMEIILGLLALEAGLIGERLFVALVVMALVTSMTSGTLMQRALGRVKPVRFWDHATAKTFIPALLSTTRDDAIAELAHAATSGGKVQGIDPAAVASSAQARERLVGSGLGSGVAVPHARLPGLTQPIVAIGRSTRGIDFGARDGEPAHLIILLISPLEDPELQLRLLASVAGTCQDPGVVKHLMSCANWTELLASLNEGA